MSSIATESPDYLAELEGEYGPGIVQRGLAYANEGRVTIRSIEQDPLEIHVEASVQGSEAQPYQVDLWLSLNAAGGVRGVDSDCSCPIGMDCKHVVATLWVYSQKAGWVQPDGATVPGAAVFPEPSTEAISWLEGLDENAVVHANPTSTQLTAAAGKKVLPHRVVYLLRPGTPMRMALGKSRQNKSGELGKSVGYQPQAYDLGSMRSHREFILDEDISPLRLFMALQAGTSFHYQDDVELTGETGALLLRQALRTGRLYREGMMQQPITVGQAQPLIIGWERNFAGLQQALVRLPEPLQEISTWPMFYLDAAQNQIGEMVSELPETILQKLLAAPPLNDADAPLVRQQLGRIGEQRGLNIPLPEVPDSIVACKPVAQIMLTARQFRSLAAKSGYETHAIATLQFNYPEGVSVVGAEHPSPMMRRQTASGQWETLLRDLATERDTWAALQALGFETYRQRLPGYQAATMDDCLMPGRSDAEGWIPFLETGIEALEQTGIKVIIAEDFPFHLTAADEWFVGVEEAGSEWFNLDLGVMVGTEKVSLVPPLLTLLKDNPKFLDTVRGLDDTTNVPVALDARRILSVPAGRLKAWLLPLLEFLDDDKPRLARHHASALAGLEAHATQWIGNEELRQLAKKLQDFSGMTHQPPAPGFQATLRPYQQVGLNWLQFLREYGLAGILADDMGLGKTVQTLAHLHLEKASGRAKKPSLVVATTSLMVNWKNEAAQFTPDLKVLVLHGKDRAEHFDKIATADIILTTYPLIVRDRDVLLAQDYHLLVLDEAQFIKNPKAQAHQVARQLKARHRLSLTGTPLENHLGELWAQFDFLLPGLLGRAQRFAKIFRTPIEKMGDDEMRQRLADRVKPFLLRRTKEQVLKDLPPRTEIVRWVELEGSQRDIYESLRVVFDKKLREVLAQQGAGRSQIMILDALLKLRQVCCDPRLVKLPTTEALVKKGTVPSAKLEALLEMLEELLDEGRKVLLFSQFTSMLTLIEEALKERNLRYVKLTGQTTDRETPIREFQEGQVPLFLISLKAGGTGLNLTAADTVIHYDPWWNPAVEEQATARAHRIGQDKPVFVYKLLTQGTVEEKILALQNRKRGMAEQLMRQRSEAVENEESGGHLITTQDLDVLFQPLI